MVFYPRYYTAPDLLFYYTYLLLVSFADFQLNLFPLVDNLLLTDCWSILSLLVDGPRSESGGGRCRL